MLFKGSFSRPLLYKSHNSSLLYCRVVVPLRNAVSIGFVVGNVSSFEEEACRFKIFEIIKTVDQESIIDIFDFDFARWMEKYYFSSLGDILSLFFSFREEKEVRQKTKKLEKKQEELKKLSLNVEQRKAADEIVSFWEKSDKRIALLKGPTGSGKSFVFCDLIKKQLKKKKSVLLLVPEISIALQMQQKFIDFLGGKKVHIFHSKVSLVQKKKILKAVREDAGLVIGTRSALFIPKWNNLGLVIVDEEHEEAYKNNASPRYHVRQVTQIMAKRRKIPLLFASATPSVELLHYCKNKQVFLAQLTKSFNTKNVPIIKVIPVEYDKEAEARDDHSLSKESFQAIFDVMESGNQAIIYLNRRGFSAAISCKECGAFLQCPHCDISLIYHKKKKEILCHYCDYKQISFSAMDPCQKCGAKKGYSFFKAGTEKVYDHIKDQFSDYTVARFDSDTLTTPKKMNDLINKFSEGEVNILVGTQMLAKGHDFDKAMLMVILYPENALNLPDYRSLERFFSSIIQAKGRVGRKLAGESKVFVETFTPGDETLSLILNGEENKFYEKEINYRKQFLYPPFSKLCRFVVRDKNREKSLKTAQKIADFFRNVLKSKEQENHPFIVLGPASCMFGRVAEKYRFHVIVKIFEMSFFQAVMQKVRDENKNSFFSSEKSFVEIDMDPVDLF